ncbi:MAG: hypothetical protein RLY97_509 [Pseudomonadota bacterium]|jgi:hypothetical protein
MNPFPPEFNPAQLGNLAGKIQPQPSLLARQWSALHRAAVAVSGLAGEAVRPLSPEMRDFSENITRIGGWQLSLAKHGVADLAAVMEPGLTALISVHARGADPQPPARALLEEFNSACAAIVSLAHEESDPA